MKWLSNLVFSSEISERVQNVVFLLTHQVYQCIHLHFLSLLFFQLPSGIAWSGWSISSIPQGNRKWRVLEQRLETWQPCFHDYQLNTYSAGVQTIWLAGGSQLCCHHVVFCLAGLRTMVHVNMATQLFIAASRNGHELAQSCDAHMTQAYVSAILRSTVMCIGGIRSRYHLVNDTNITLSCSEGCVPQKQPVIACSQFCYVFLIPPHEITFMLLVVLKNDI